MSVPASCSACCTTPAMSTRSEKPWGPQRTTHQRRGGAASRTWLTTRRNTLSLTFTICAEGGRPSSASARASAASVPHIASIEGVDVRYRQRLHAQQHDGAGQAAAPRQSIAQARRGHTCVSVTHTHTLTIRC